METHICLVCGEKFNRRDSLKVHLSNHSYKVEHFEDQSLPSGHSCSEGPCKSLFDLQSFDYGAFRFKTVHHVCSVCGREFKRKDHLLKHAVLHSGQRPFSCCVCGKAFTRKDRLKEHAVVHSECGWVCYFCGRMFSQRSILRKHEMIHRGVKPFTCEMCDSRFSRKNDMVRHYSSHTGEKSHFCQVCSKGFGQKRLLKRHSRLHQRGC